MASGGLGTTRGGGGSQRLGKGRPVPWNQSPYQSHTRSSQPLPGSLLGVLWWVMGSEHRCLSSKVPEHGRVTISVVISPPSGDLQCRLYHDVCLPQRYFLGGRSTLSWIRVFWAPLLILIKTVLGHRRARQRLYIPLPSARSSAASGSLWPGIVGFL